MPTHVSATPDDLATIKHLYCYPVKAMRGVEVEQVYLGLNGIEGDRRYAFVRQDRAGVDGFPWLTGRTQARMLLYAPHFAGPLTPDDADPPLTVTTPEGEQFDVT